MSNPSTVILQLSVAGISNGIALSQTPAVAGPLTLNGSLVTAGVANLGTTARRVAIASTGSDASVVFTLIGTDRNGNVQSETITGVVSGTPVSSARDYLTVTAVSSSAATAGAITVGTNSIGSSAWVMDDPYKRFWALSGGISGPAGTTYSLEHTYDDPNTLPPSLTTSPQQFSLNPASFVPAMVWPFSSIVAASGNNQFVYANWGIMAHRVTIISGTGQVVMQSLQVGID